MNLLIFIAGSTAVWRITHLLYAEDGPFDLIFRLRRKAGAGFFGNLLDCFYCLSIWIALPFAIWLGGTIPEMLLLWPAFSGAACLLQKATDKGSSGHPPAEYQEDEP